MKRIPHLILIGLTAAQLPVAAQVPSEIAEACQRRSANLQKINAVSNGNLSPGCLQTIEQAENLCLNSPVSVDENQAQPAAKNKPGVRSYFKGLQKTYAGARDQSVSHALTCKNIAQSLAQECTSNEDSQARMTGQLALRDEHDCANSQSKYFDDAARSAQANADAISADSSQQQADSNVEKSEPAATAIFSTTTPPALGSKEISSAESSSPVAKKTSPAPTPPAEIETEAVPQLTGEVLEGPLSPITRFFSASKAEPLNTAKGAMQNESAITALSGK